MLANIARQLIRVLQFLGALGTLIAHCKETAYINTYEALLANDTADMMSGAFVPQVPSVVLFLVSGLSIVASLTIGVIAFRTLVRIKRIERAVAFVMVLLWGISVTAVFALDGQFFADNDADSPYDTSDTTYDVEIQLITCINVTRAMALLALASWTLGLMSSLLSDCFSDCHKTHDMEKAQLSNWPLNMTAPPEYSERYGELPHHTHLKPPSTLTSNSSYHRNSFYKTPMEVATRSSSPMALSHYEDMSSTHSWESSSSPSSPLTPTHGLELPPLAHSIPDDPATANGLRPFSGIPTIRILSDGPEQDVLPTSFAYLITNPKPVASLRRASSLG